MKARLCKPVLGSKHLTAASRPAVTRVPAVASRFFRQVTYSWTLPEAQFKINCSVVGSNVRRESSEEIAAMLLLFSTGITLYTYDPGGGDGEDIPNRSVVAIPQLIVTSGTDNARDAVIPISFLVPPVRSTNAQSFSGTSRKSRRRHFCEIPTSRESFGLPEYPWKSLCALHSEVPVRGRLNYPRHRYRPPYSHRPSRYSWAWSRPKLH